MNDLKVIIANNIASLRKAKKMTQLTLANELNYSDKAISKWERGESTPDISILKQLADFFEVTVDYLLCEHTGDEYKNIAEEYTEVKNNIMTQNDVNEMNEMILAEVDASTKKSKIDKKSLILLSTSPVWILSTLIFILVSIFSHKYVWTILYASVPLSFLLILIFNSIWGNARKNYAIISCLVWTSLLFVYLTFINEDLIQIFLLGIPAQAVIILWSKLKK